MLRKLLCFFALIISAYAAGEFIVLTSPPSALFKGHDHLKEGLLSEVYTAALGFTTEQDSNWQGMFISEPFNLAKGIVTVAVDGVADIGHVKGHNFPLKTDEDESDIYDEMVRRIEDHQPFGGKQLVRVELKQGLYAIDGVNMFKGIKNIKPAKTAGGALNLTIEEDRDFLEEISLLNAIADKVESSPPKRGFAPELFWFRLASLHAVCDLYGENSTPAKEAKSLLRDAVGKLNSAFNAYFEGRVLVNIITSDASHTRRVRRETNEASDKDDAKVDYDKLNLSKTYNADYPVIFNIMLWFGVAMFFSLLAISLFIGNMDPGRDSIIYRMTSTRMKKDN